MPLQLVENAERENTLVAGDATLEDLSADLSLRPKYFREYIGQVKLVSNLQVFLKAALLRGEALDHVLFYGPPGLGKTSLAMIIANELGTNLKTVHAPSVEKSGDLASMLASIEEGDVLFIDEIHRVSHVVEEFLYPAMEDYVIDIMIDKGPNARSVKINVPKFTLVGATTRSGLLTAPLRSRFGIVEHMNYYEIEELASIIRRSSRILKIEIDAKGELEIAKRSRGTPRIANRLLRRVRDFAQVKAQGKITREVADQALQMLHVDPEGLDIMDQRILTYILNDCDGGPVGISSLAVGIGEEPETLEEVYEPYLIQKGFLKRTSTGRVATRRAYEHFNLIPPKSSSELF